jgi:hypothetical protein
MSNHIIAEDIIYPSEDLSSVNITFEPPIIDSYHSTHELDEKIANTEPLAPIESHSQRHISTTFKPIPNIGKGPVGNYYANINWDNGFEAWNLVRFSTPMDGSCLFHAISNSFFAPYHKEILHGKRVNRTKMVEALRMELSQKLASKVSDSPNALTYYDTLNGGNTSAFSEAVPEFELSYMQNQLNSHTSIGYGYMEFIGNALDKDIYILEAIRRDIYVTDELSLTIKGNRNSIVLYYMNGHYELAGIHKEDGSFDTHFSHDHSFIRFLYNRVTQIAY